MIIDLLERLGLRDLAADGGDRPTFTNDDDWLCAGVAEAHPFPGNVTIECHDCRAPIVDRETSPPEPRKLCLDCYSTRKVGGHA